MTAARARVQDPSQFGDPPWARLLFADARVAWLWLVLRVYVGYEWIDAGYEKVFGAGANVWVGADAGAALKGFAAGALKKTAGDHPDVQAWYADFLQAVVVPNAGLFARLVAAGELLVGVALVLGALTGIAAFFGVVMNANYLLAGTVSSNPILIILGALLMLAWRNAGWIGLDRWLLPAIGTPWQPGGVFQRPSP